jgi:MFS family permease
MTTATTRIMGLNTPSGVTFFNLGSYYIACLCSIMLASFIPQGQPFLLTEFLNIPLSEHGVVSGTLNFWAEIVIIVCTALFGPLSDRIGRKSVISAGFFIMAGGTYLYPRATTLDELLTYRLLYAAGIAAVSCMIVTIVADYVRDESRGKATGYLGIMNGCGAMITVFLLMRLPAYFQSQGASVIDSGLQTYSLVAGITVAIGFLMILGLKSEEKKTAEEHLGIMTLARQGLFAAKDPGIALAYGVSFVARGNLMIVGTFFSLWITNYGSTELNLNRADALAKAGMVIGIAQGCALLGAPIFGILSDKMNRVSILIVALLFSIAGYGSTYFISNPTGTAMIVCAVFIGLGEIACIITSGVLIAQQTPEKIRGAVIGFFTMSGALGILVASVVGGYLYDNWRESGPFVFFAIIAFFMLLWALAVKKQIVAPSHEPL